MVVWCELAMGKLSVGRLARSVVWLFEVVGLSDAYEACWALLNDKWSFFGSNGILPSMWLLMSVTLKKKKKILKTHYISQYGITVL
jgi:hypothetical protein